MTPEEYLNDKRETCGFCGAPGCERRDCADDSFEAFHEENEWRTTEEWSMLIDEMKAKQDGKKS